MNESCGKKSDKMCAAARACLGTRFHHQGRLARCGLDCIGLVIEAMRAADVKIVDRTDYGPRPDGKTLIDGLETHGLTRVKNIEAGDVLVFRYDHQPQHVALALSSTEMIHAFAPIGRVVTTDISFYWRHRLAGIYRLIEKV